MSGQVRRVKPERHLIILDENGLYKGGGSTLKEVEAIVYDHCRRYSSDLTIYKSVSRFKSRSRRARK